MNVRKIIYNLFFWAAFVYALWVIICKYAPDFTPNVRILWSGPIAGTIAILYAALRAHGVVTEKIESEGLKSFSDKIFKGVMNFMNEQYSITLLLFLLLFALLFAYVNRQIAACFACGAIAAAVAGLISMIVAAKSHSRAATLAEKSTNKALNIIFSSSVASGLVTAGLAMIFIPALFFFFGDPDIMCGFALGACLFALFAGAGGGIFAKASNIAVSIVKNSNAQIVDNDPKNPVFTADKAGCDIAGVSGLEADLFATYVCAIVAAMVLGSKNLDLLGIFIPLTLASIGIFASILGSLFVRIKEGKNPHAALQMGEATAMILYTGLSYYLVDRVFEVEYFTPILIGILTGVLLSIFSRFYTDGIFPPVKTVAEFANDSEIMSRSGIRVGMLSVFLPILLIITSAIAAFIFADGMFSYYSGMYGISIAAVSMLSTLGITIGVNAFGAISNNSRSAAEYAHIEGIAKERLDNLNIAGHKTVAVSKGFAIGTSLLVALSLCVAFGVNTNLPEIDILNPFVLYSLLLGVAMPFLFIALVEGSALKGAKKAANEARKQLEENPEILNGSAEPNYKRCVNIFSHTALKGVVFPCILALALPAIAGIAISTAYGKSNGVMSMTAMIFGAIVCGACLAFALSNSNSAVDNAKDIAATKAGFPFERASIKDLSYSAINILTKLMPITALVFTAFFILE